MTIKNVICDIDGVLMHDNVAVPGAAEFLHGIMDKGLPLVLLTNYPSQTGQDLANRFATAGVDVPDSVFYTSAMATADFLRRQEGKKAYVVGEGALIHELYKAGFTITDVNPDFVIVGLVNVDVPPDTNSEFCEPSSDEYVLPLFVVSLDISVAPV